MANDPVRERFITSILLGAAGLITVIILLVHTMNANGVSRFPEAGGGKPDGVREASLAITPTSDDANDYTYWGAGSTLLYRPDSTASLVQVRIGRREYSNEEDRNGLYISFFDYREKKEMGAKKLVPSEDNVNPDVKLRQFGTGNLYFILDQRRLFRINKNTLGVTELTPSIIQRQPALKGMTAMQWIPETYGDGLTLQTRSGKTLYYFPRINKIYSQRQFKLAAAANK